MTDNESQTVHIPHHRTSTGFSGATDGSDSGGSSSGGSSSGGGSSGSGNQAPEFTSIVVEAVNPETNQTRVVSIFGSSSSNARNRERGITPVVNPNNEIKYYKSDGTPVYGRRDTTASVPTGAIAATGANIQTSRIVKQQLVQHTTSTGFSAAEAERQRQETALRQPAQPTDPRGWNNLYREQGKARPAPARKQNKNLLDRGAELIMGKDYQTKQENRAYRAELLAKTTELQTGKRSNILANIAALQTKTAETAPQQKDVIKGGIVAGGIAGGYLIGTWLGVPAKAEAIAVQYPKIAGGANLVKNVALTTTKGVVTYKGIMQAEKSLSPTAEKKYLEGEQFKEATAAGFERETYSIKGGRGARTSIENYYLNMGYDSKAAERLAKQATSSKENYTNFFKGIGYEGAELEKQTATYRTPKGFFRSLGYDTFMYGDKPQFEAGVKDYYKSKGLSGAELDTAVKATLDQRSLNPYARVGAFFGANVQSEVIGQLNVAKNFLKGTTGAVTQKNVASQIFMKTFNPIGKAGISEGVSIDVVDQISWGKDLKEIDPKRTAIVGGASYVTAGTLGGAIAATSATKPLLSKVLTGVAYLSDPLEYPADVTAGALIDQGIFKVNTPIIIGTNTKSSDFVFTVKGKTQTPATAKTTTKTTTQTRTKASITEQMNNIIGTPTSITIDPIISTPILTTLNTPTETKTPTDITANIDTIAETPTTPEIPPNIFTNVPVNIQTPINTNINVGTPVSVPVTVPRGLTLPPPFPLAFATGSGGGGFTKAKRKKFVGELALAGNLLKNITIPAPKFETPKIKKSKKSKKQNKIFEFPNIFPRLNL